MEKIQTFFSSFTFLLGFMFTCIFIQMLFGKEVLTKFLWLILAGMILTNSKQFISVLSNAGKNNATTKTTTNNDNIVQRHITGTDGQTKNVWKDGSAGAMF